MLQEHLVFTLPPLYCSSFPSLLCRKINMPARIKTIYFYNGKLWLGYFINLVQLRNF